MKKIFVFFVISLFWANLAEIYAQRYAQDYWHKNGKVKLEDGSVYEGDLKFDLENEIVQLQVDGVLKTFTSRKIQAFEFFDTFEQKDRYYYALPYAKVSNYKTATFFELLLQDTPVSLLCRESLTTQTYTNNSPYYVYQGPPITRTVIKNEYYFLYKNGNIALYDGTKKGLLYLLRDREKALKDYLRDNRVNFENKNHLMDLINFYNLQSK